MRVAILAIIVAVISVTALLRPRIGLYGYIWFAVMRPDVLAWVEGEYEFSTVLAVAVLVGSARYVGQFGRLFASPITRWLLALQVPLFVSYILAVRQDLSETLYFSFVKMLVVPFLIPVLIETREQVQTLLLVIGCSLGFLGSQFGFYGLLHGGVVLINGYGEGMLSDNNLLALGLNMGIPLCWYCRQLVDSVVMKWTLTVMMCLSAAAVVMTNSRGGSIALGVVVLLIVFRLKNRLAGALVVLAFLGGTIYLIRDEYVARMATLENPNEESSAASRLTHATMAIRIWKDYPLTGVGFGGQNYRVLAERYSGGELMGHVAHNSYLQMLVDSGCFAFLIYGGVLLGTVIWLRPNGRDPSPVLRYAIQTSLIAFMVGGTFYSCQRYDVPYILMLSAGALWRIDVQNNPVEEASVGHVEMEAV